MLLLLIPNTLKMQVLINQLKEVAPSIQKSISECTEKLNGISSNLPSMAKHRGQTTSPMLAQSSRRTLVNVQTLFHCNANVENILELLNMCM